MRFLCPALLLALATWSVAADTLTIRTSQSVAPIIEAAKAPFLAAHPGVEIALLGVPSPASIKAVASGEAGLGGIVRELNAKEKEANPDLITTPIARDGVVLAVNAANPLTGVTLQQARDIFTGVTTSWKAVGGSDAPIAIIGRVETNLLNEFLEQKLGMEHQVEGEGKAQTMSFKPKGAGAFTHKFSVTGSHKDALAQLLLNEQGFTFLPLGLAVQSKAKGNPIRILALDGVEPSAEAINGGKYLLSRTLYLLTKGQPTGTVKDLVDLILSPAGQTLVSERGNIPLK